MFLVTLFFLFLFFLSSFPIRVVDRSSGISVFTFHVFSEMLRTRRWPQTREDLRLVAPPGWVAQSKAVRVLLCVERNIYFEVGDKR